MKSKILIVLLLVILLVGCSNNNSDNDNQIDGLTDEDYAVVFPFESSDTRIAHYNFSPSTLQIQEIGLGLINYSKDYFSTNDYIIREGQVLTYDDLVVGTNMEDTTGLLGRSTTTNPIGLNPERNSKFLLSNGTTKEIENPVLILDIYEVDMMKQSKDGYQLEGISLAIAVSDTLTVDDGLYGIKYKMDPDKFQLYIEETARKVVTHVRNKPEVDDDLPIYVTIYNADNDDMTLPGKFISEAFFEGRSGEFNSLLEQWIMFPSSEAAQIDNITYNKFLELKDNLDSFLPENVSIIGKGLYKDSKLNRLNITVTIQGKTYNEVNSTILYVQQLLENFSDTSATYVVEIKVVNDTVAIMNKDRGTSNIKLVTIN